MKGNLWSRLIHHMALPHVFIHNHYNDCIALFFCELILQILEYFPQEKERLVGNIYILNLKYI